MPYNARIREYWLEVAEHTCQYEYYDEERGFVQCTEPATQVHHIKGERETLAEGKDPNENTALPLCEKHHVRNTLKDYELGDAWEKYFSFHPDIALAYRQYSEWKQAQQHLNSINGKMSLDYSTSPFADVARLHKEMVENGERYIAGSDEIDEYYERKMIDKATRYNAINGKLKPKCKPHKDLKNYKKSKDE